MKTCSFPHHVKFRYSAIEGFVKAASLDVPGKQRINVVSPILLEESKDKYGDLFNGHATIPGKDVGQAYRKLIFGIQNGETLKVGWY